MTLTGEGEPQRLMARPYRRSFSICCACRIAGATFTMDDDQPDTHRVVVLSGGFWRRRLEVPQTSLERR